MAIFRLDIISFPYIKKINGILELKSNKTLADGTWKVKELGKSCEMPSLNMNLRRPGTKLSAVKGSESELLYFFRFRF